MQVRSRWYEKYRANRENVARAEFVLRHKLSKIMKVTRGPKNLTIETKPKLSREWWSCHKLFTSALFDSKKAIERAGAALVKMIAIEPDTKEVLISMHPDTLNLPFLDSLESVGLGTKRAEILLLQRGIVANTLGSLNRAGQDEAIDSGLLCARKTKNGIVTDRIKLAHIKTKDLRFMVRDGEVVAPEGSDQAARIETGSEERPQIRHRRSRKY